METYSMLVTSQMGLLLDVSLRIYVYGKMDV